MTLKHVEDIDVAIVCALPVEVDAVSATLDESYDNLQQWHYDRSTSCQISCKGKVKQHRVGVIQLPGMGKNNAAGVASALQTRFPNVQLVLVVGICGGVPFPYRRKEDIFLGDVVIADSVVEYDMGKRYPGSFERKKSAKYNYTRTIRSFISSFQTRSLFQRLQKRVSHHLNCLQCTESNWEFPGRSLDKVFEGSYMHMHCSSNKDAPYICNVCNYEKKLVCQEALATDCEILGCEGALIVRDLSEERTKPMVHFGTVASGDTVMKSAEDRDRLAREEDIIAFEMEAAAVWDNLDGIPCLVIKGVSDYADSHKNKKWQRYAAATAASCAKAVLECWRPFRRRGIQVPDLNEHSDELPQIYSVSVAQNPFFSGREYELNRLKSIVSSHNGTSSHDNSYPIIAVYGLGGIGKTQLVTEFVFRYHEENANSSILWISAASLDSIESSYDNIGMKLKSMLIREEHNRYSTHKHELFSASSGKELVKVWMSLAKNWVIVLDNYDDLTVNVQDFLPKGTSNGFVIITTRDKRVIGPVATSGFRLEQMGLNDSVELFLKLLRISPETAQKDQCLNSEIDKIHDIVRELHGIPLAIDQAAAFIRENSPTFTEYLHYLRQTHDRELLFRFTRASSIYQGSIMTAWEVSFNHLQRKSPRTAMLLQILGFFHHSNVFEKMLLKATGNRSWAFTSLPPSQSLNAEILPEVLLCLVPDAGFRTSIGLLCSFSLVSRDSTKEELAIHPLVHEWIRTRLNSNPLLQERLSLCAALTIFQSFPFELVFEELGGNNWIASNEITERINIILSHFEWALLNLMKYFKSSTSHIDCITLLLAIPLIRRTYTIEFHSLVSEESYEKFRGWFPLYLGRAPTKYKFLISMVWKLLQWSEEGEQNEALWAHRAANILYALKSIRGKLNAPPMLMLIFTRLFTDFCHLISHKTKHAIGKIISFDTDQLKEDQSKYQLVNNNSEARNLTARLIYEFRRTINFETNDFTFRNAATLYTEILCVSHLSVEEFWRQPSGPLIDDPISVDLRHFHQGQEALFISMCCMLQWERVGHRNLEQLQRIYEFGISRATYYAKQLRDELEDRSEGQSENASLPMLSYLSNTWGRTSHGSVENSLLGRNSDSIVSPYLQRTILDVIRALSDVTQRWIPLKSSTRERRLKKNERLCAIRMFRSWREFIAAMHQVKALLYDAYYRDCLRIELIHVSLNLDEWDIVLRAAGDMLHLDAIVSKHGRTGQRFWEPLEAQDDVIPGKSAPGETSQYEVSSTSMVSRFFLYAVRVFYNPKSLSGDANVRHGAWIRDIKGHANGLSRSKMMHDHLELHRQLNELNYQVETVNCQLDEMSKPPLHSFHGAGPYDIESEEFALSILTEHMAINVANCLVSSATNEALKAMATALQMSGRMKLQAYDDVMNRLQLLLKESSVLVKCLGKLALIMCLSKFPYPSMSIGIEGEQNIHDRRNDVFDDLYLLDSYDDVSGPTFEDSMSHDSSHHELPQEPTLQAREEYTTFELQL